MAQLSMSWLSYSILFFFYACHSHTLLALFKAFSIPRPELYFQLTYIIWQRIWRFQLVNVEIVKHCQHNMPQSILNHLCHVQWTPLYRYFCLKMSPCICIIHVAKCWSGFHHYDPDWSFKKRRLNEDITIIKQRLNVQFKDNHLDGSGGGDSISKQRFECYLLLFSELPKVLNTSSECTTRTGLCFQSLWRLMFLFLSFAFSSFIRLWR